MAAGTAVHAKDYRAIPYSFTRPADTNAYTAGDIIANSTTGTSVVVPSFVVGTSGGSAPFVIPRVRLHKTTAGVTNPSFRLHLFSAVPTLTGAANTGDNAAAVSNVTTGAASWIGSYSATLAAAFVDGAAVDLEPTQALRRFDRGVYNQSFYGILTATAAYAPGDSEIFTLTLIQEFVL